ncbi:hypothetical protein RND71_012739 [Anisodus tanguticus]|uniref:Ion transport domain-containing protein n=1 Tax=Anisodus tanguticus TaxID=243964 RepID=A0AAE1VH90_9SOLA|nr:hypothetical protein RND71_012739 [Anisodus tanguticus]
MVVPLAVDIEAHYVLNVFRTIPEIPKDDFEFIFKKLDVAPDSKLPIFEACPSFYHSPASGKLRDFVRGAMFECIIVFILLVNLVAVIVETTLDMQNNSAQTFWQKVEIAFDIEEMTTLADLDGLNFMSNGNCYLLFNFNDYPTGMVTVFNLLVMGIWAPVMQEEGREQRHTVGYV